MEEINPSTSQYTLTLEPQNHPDESAETKAFKLYRGSFDDDVGEYYFESDHLALKGNGDYRMLLKCVAILEAQRSRAIQDLDRLIKAKEKALANPIEFVEKLQMKEDMNLPQLQEIYSIPLVDWEKYSRNVNFASLTHKHMTRHKKSNATTSSVQPGIDNSSGQPAYEQRNESDDSAISVVRGRICNTGKSQTFNQLWTVEEQKKLEDLLVKYPPEEVEARRWEKIAKALINRTPQQVASRVQKYFIKLTKAGLPVPGRIPNLSSYSKRGSTHRHHRHNRFLFHQSTFFASHEPPVFMSEYGDDNTNHSTTSSLDDDNSFHSGFNKKMFDEELIPPEFHHTEEYQELLQLKRMKKLKEGNRAPGLTQHVGFACCRCKCEPIIGRRWRCVDCPPLLNLNFCDSCSDSNYENADHHSGHRLEQVVESHNALIDLDYTQFLHGDYNYLDPNYMPAT